MTQTLSAENLIKCLIEKDRYKATQAYLHQVTLFNETVYEMFNQAFQTVLSKAHRNYMSKLMAMRLFKQLVVCANFTLIDGLDENIEDLILSAAQYNKKSKQVSRGANYFVDIDKQKKDAQIQKIGATFVLLASQILVVLGRWHPVEDDGEQSRFSQYLKELQDGGVSLPQESQLTFFKKDDQQKYKKNYSKWLKWYVQKVKEEEFEDTNRQIKEENNHQSSKVQEKKVQPKINKPSVEQSTLNVPNSIPLNAPVEQIKVEAQKIPDKTLINNIKIEPQTKAQPIKETAKQTEKEKLEYEKWKEQIISKYEGELASLRDQNGLMKRQVSEATNLMSKTHEQKIKLQEQLYTKSKQINQLSQQKQELEGIMNKLSDVDSKEKQHIAECFQIKINPPKVYEQLEEQNDILQVALEAAQQHFHTKKKQLEQQLQLTKQQNHKLARTLKLKEEQIKKWKQETNIEKEMVTNIIKEDSLVITQEINFMPLQDKRLKSAPKEKIELFSKTCTMSEYLSNQKHLRQNIEPKLSSRNRSLRKTQSTHKISTMNNCQHFYNTTINPNKAGYTNLKLAKTSNTYNKRSFESTNSLITIFPYLQSYFPALSQQSRHFKTYCLDVKNKLCLCFQNELIKIALKKINWSKYIVTVSNKLDTQLKIKITSQHRTFMVQGQKYRKIKPYSSQKMQLANLQFDINLRYLSLNCITGNQKISLTNSHSNDRIFSVPLPITILDFCRFSIQDIDYWFYQSKRSKYSSNKLGLGSCQPNFMHSLTSFKLNYDSTGLSAKTVAELYGESKAKVMIEVYQTQYEVCISIEFASDSLQSSNLAKVLLQAMLFLIQL